MIALRINGRDRIFEGPPFKRLIDVLRDDLGLTGTKEGCGEGECGACTVLVDGAPVNSCLIPVCQVASAAVETVESLGRPEALSPLQTAFLRDGGAQCGICTPGMLMAAWAYVRGGGAADDRAIRDHLAGNLCRCTGYQQIVDAVIATVRAAKKRSARAGARRAAAKAAGASRKRSSRIAAKAKKAPPARRPKNVVKKKAPRNKVQSRRSAVAPRRRVRPRAK